MFNLFEGFGGVGRGEAEIAGLLEFIGLPLTGSPAACLALARDKARTKWLLAGSGLPTPAFEGIAADGPLNLDALDRLLANGAVIVKPAAEDASLGIGRQSIVTDRAALVRQIETVRGPVRGGLGRTIRRRPRIQRGDCRTARAEGFAVGGNRVLR